MAIENTQKAAVIATLTRFKESSTDVAPVLIISYEQVRTHIELLETIPFGLVVCDEVNSFKCVTILRMTKVLFF